MVMSSKHFEPAEGLQCNTPLEGFSCTRTRDHTEDHEAHGGHPLRVLCSWPQVSSGFHEAFGYCPAETSDGAPEGWQFKYHCTLDAHPPGTRHEAHGASPLPVWRDGAPLEFDLSHECQDCRS